MGVEGAYKEGLVLWYTFTLVYRRTKVEDEVPNVSFQVYQN